MKNKIMMSVLVGVLVIGITGCNQQERESTDNTDYSEEIDVGNAETQEKIDLEQCLQRCTKGT